MRLWNIPFPSKVRVTIGKPLPENPDGDRALFLLPVYTATAGDSLDLPAELLNPMLGSLIDCVFQLVTHIAADDALRAEIMGGGILVEFLKTCASELACLSDDQILQVRALAVLALRFDGASAEDQDWLNGLIHHG